MTRRTVLIGLDGATYTILDSLMAEGAMPFLRSLAQSGVRADLRTIIPPLTPPAWTSLMTGRSPAHHGIFDFFQRESPDSMYLRFASSNEVASETVWSMASRQGLRVTALNFPLMFPARPINGFVVPGGWVPWKQLRVACYPPDLYDRLKALPGFNARELAMDMKVEEKAIEGCKDDEYEEWITFHIRREEHWFEILRHLMSEDPCELTAVMFDGVDKLQHLCWIYLDPAYADLIRTPEQRRIRELCVDYFRGLDGIIERIAALAGPDANILLASDHGFGPTVEVFHVNTWLAQHGYLAWTERASEVDGSAVLGMQDLGRYASRFDWMRTRAYAATPSSNGIHIVRPGQTPGPGVSDADYERFRDELVARLYDVKDPVSGEPVVAHIATRAEAFNGPRGELAPDLTLALRDGGLVSILPSDEPLRPREKPSGAHRPVGIFLASGPDIRTATHAGELSILDVAPTILYSLGLPIPTSLEGRMPEEIIKPEHLQAEPPRVDAGNGDPAPPENKADEQAPAEAIVHPVMDAETEAVIMNRLRALGYVE